MERSGTRLALKLTRKVPDNTSTHRSHAYVWQKLVIERQHDEEYEMAETIPDKEELLKRAVYLFKLIFNEEPAVAASAPGRVNLIGEHTDYNDGFVLPVALPLFTVIVGKVNNSGEIYVYTDADVGGEPQISKFNTPTAGQIRPGQLRWANYVKGVVEVFKGNVPGFDAVVVSSVPVGGGLSSSASLEVAMYTFLELLTGQRTELKQKAILCQQAEHRFANVPCGIMDQYVSVMAKPESVLFLDCERKDYDIVPFGRGDVAILVTNSNVMHFLNSSDEYSSRKRQCMEATKILGVSSLRKADMDLLEANRNKLDDVTYRRARHVISEMARTITAAKALKIEDYETFGRLMVESHMSLRDDYDVSCSELDQLVDIAVQCEGVLGSRMTGGGFGGCTVTLVKKSFVDETIEKIQNGYDGNATFYVVHPTSGAQDEMTLLRSLLRM